MSGRRKVWTLDDATLVDSSIVVAQAGLPRRIVPSTKYAAAVLADNPTAFYQFEELGGTILYDSGPNAITGTLVSGSLGLTGREGSALAGNGGTGPAARLSRHASLEPTINTPFSIEFWYYGQVYNAGVTTVLGNNGQWWVFTNGGVLNLRVGGGSGYYDYQLNATAGIAGQWNHFAVTYNGGAASNSGKWYLNGVLTNQLTQIFGMTAYTYYTGASLLEYNQPAGTKIDNVAFYNGTVLTPTQILNHYSGSAAAFNPSVRWQTTLDTAATDVWGVMLPIHGLGVTGSMDVMLSASNMAQTTVKANEFLPSGTYAATGNGTTLYVSSALGTGQYMADSQGSGAVLLYDDGVSGGGGGSTQGNITIYFTSNGQPMGP
jgi:hypothetical protein